MKKYSQETVVGIFVVLGLLCIGYMTVKLGDVSLFEDDTYSLYAEFNTVSGLREGNPVEMWGLEIGRVENFNMDAAQRVAVVELKIQNNIKIYDDAIASIKTAGLIGDKYVSVHPGGLGELLKEGDAILETESPIDLGDIISKYAFGKVE
jgi:phospholipid/cholesterol/gamma-HCH transport system substrate-binding protein